MVLPDQNDSTLVVHGNVNFDSNASLSFSGGSTGRISGNLNNAFSSLVIDNSTLVEGSEFSLDEGFNTVEHGGNLVVKGSYAIGLDFLPLGYSFLKLIGSGNTATLNSVTNNGLVEVDVGSVLTVKSGGFANVNVVSPLNSFVTATVNLGGTMSVNGGFTNNGGSVLLYPTANLKTDTYAQSGGITDISGTLVAKSYQQSAGTTFIETGGLVSATTFNATGGTVTVNGILDPTAVEIGSRGALQGTGTIIGNVAMGGTIIPGAPGTPGTLTIFGNYEQTGNGTLEELMSPFSKSLLDVKGSVALDSDSRLNIILLNGHDPLGKTFSILDDKSLVGQFSNGSSFREDGFLWDVTYGQHEIDVTAVSVSTPEPSSLLLLSIGLAALAFYAHRKMGKTKRLA
jgi:PEP-CTERM motif-containing protein